MRKKKHLLDDGPGRPTQFLLPIRSYVQGNAHHGVYRICDGGFISWNVAASQSNRATIQGELWEALKSKTHEPVLRVRMDVVKRRRSRE